MPTKFSALFSKKLFHLRAGADSHSPVSYPDVHDVIQKSMRRAGLPFFVHPCALQQL